MSTWIGRTLGKVELRQLAGRGGMAEVYLGEHTSLARLVAVKVLHAHLSDDPLLPARVEREARAVASLRHPNIVQVFDFDVIDDRPYIVMEWITGISLADYLGAQRRLARTVPPEIAARVIAAIAAALDYAHARGVVHRDVKPANVLLRSEAGPIDPAGPLPRNVEPVLTDFGVALVLGGGLTTTGSLLGTPAYMSPEQARGDSVDGRSDVYSLGVVLYELLAGKPPFDPETTTPASLLVRHITEPPPPLPTVSPTVQTVLERALAKDSEERYEKAGDLAADLLDAIGAPTDTVARVRPVGDLPTHASIRPATKPSKLLGRRDGLLGVIAVILVLVIGVALFGRDLLSVSSPPDRTEMAVTRGEHVATRTSSDGERAPSANLAQATASVSLTPASSGARAPAKPSLTPGAAATPSIGGHAAEHSATSGQTSVTPVASTGTEPVGVIRFANRLAALDEAIITVDGLPTPAVGTHYEVWLLGSAGESRQRLGVLPIDAAGRGELVFVDPDARNLLMYYDHFAITAEPSPDPNPLPTDRVVYSGALPTEALVHVRHLLVSFPDAPDSDGLVVGLLRGAELLDTSADDMLAALQAGKVDRVRRNAEVIVNLIEGRNGANVGDLDRDGKIAELGDGFGLLLNGRNVGYVQGTIDHARNAANSADATPHIKLHADHVEAAARNVGEWALSLRDLCRRIASESPRAADVRQAAAQAKLLLRGRDLNGNEIVEPVPGEAGARTAHEHAVFLADMLVLGETDNVSEAEPGGASPTPRPVGQNSGGY